MSRKLSLTLACGDYEIVRALKEGIIEPDGIDLTVLTDMDSGTRHWRCLRGREFDVAELSCSSFLVARDKNMPFVAIPVFLHRRFRHGFMFINKGKGITKPTDLIGRKVGLKQFQSSAIVWMRGILAHEYGVPLESIDWFTDLEESVEFDHPPGVRITRVADNSSVEDMLAEGELDAALHPELIRPLVEKDPRVGRLFPDYRQEEVRYYQKTEIFPIMHLLGIKREVVERHPWVPINLYRAFNEAKTIAMKRMANPRIVPLVFYRDEWEAQEEMFGPDPWEYGLEKQNRSNIETIVGYSAEQGLIGHKPEIEDLFLDVSEGHKRGDASKI